MALCNHRVIHSYKEHPSVKVEVLIPDFQGKTDDLDIVIGGRPDVINHNIETVPSLYRDIRKGSLYGRSLDVLSYIKEKSPKTLTKTGIMLGLGKPMTSYCKRFVMLLIVRLIF